MPKAKPKLTIIKLLTNELIIAKVSKKESSFQLQDPLEIYMKRTPAGVGMLFIMPWLPKEIIENHSVEIFPNQVVYMSEPTDKFIQYYDKALGLYQKLLDQNTDLLNTNIDDFLSSNTKTDISMSEMNQNYEEDYEDEELSKMKIHNKNIH